ncbi:MAG: SDR family NAD(P)-dependent oxidoreductase [Lachnospiraceae bacterium]|nr:SDR family NAD(P)-dependent oxidoreductase [Lachnospiraceae bacterium]
MSGFKELLTRVKKNEITPAEAMNIIKESNESAKGEKTSNYYFENCLLSRPKPISKEQRSFGNIVVVCEKEEFVEKLRKEIDKRGHKYSSLNWVNKECELDNEKIKDTIDTIIYMQAELKENDWQKKIEKSIYSFIAFLKSVVHLCKHTYIEYVCFEENVGEPVFSSMIGFLRSFAKEHNLRGYKNITIRKGSKKNICTIILDEYEEEDPDVVYDGVERKCYDIKRYFSQENIRSLIPGIYIITGGCGGLGRFIANYLVDNGLYKIILVGRSDAGEKIHNICRELSRNNCEVIYKKADVCSEKDVKQLFDFVHKAYGKVAGVIHSAGVLSDKLFINKTQDDYNSVLSVKMHGTVNLYKYLDNDAVMILFSSITSVTGNIGQTDYGYANEFMNKFALENNQKEGKKRILSICWPLWENGGMQIDKDREKNIEKAVGSKLISNEDGLEAFCQAISSDVASIVVMNGRYEKIMAHLAGIKAVAHISDKNDNKENDIMSPEKMKEALSGFLLKVIADEIESDVDEISVQDNFETFGLNSIMNMNVIGKIEENICPVSKTILYECHSIEELTNYMLKEYNSQCYLAFNHIVASEQKENKQEQSFTEEIKETENEENGIAVIGIAGLYPHSRNLEEFWNNILMGNDCIDEIPTSRWNFEDYYSNEANTEGKSISKWGGFIEDYDKFDPLFFNISPRDAANIDPQERLMLQTAWHTFENAGYTKSDLNGSNTGVYIGVMYAHYQYYGIGGKNHQHGVAMTNSSISNRISYFMNLHGPCMSVDTMCSSSLTALDIACNDIKLDKIDSALVGGVNLSMHPNKYVILSQKHFLSSDGKCHSFEEGGDGYVPSEGVGAIYIKKLSKAKADGDRILAVVCSTALNHGGHTSGFTVPNPDLQGDVIKDALKKGGVHQQDVTYIEAHGTGTAIGDPIEIKGLSKAFSNLNSKKQIALGSLKSVFGHPESAAGIAAITKIILQMQNKIIPPSIVRKKVNEDLELNQTPFYLVNEPINWESNGPRVAGISSFGAGGSNAHVILEEYNDSTKVDLSLEDEKQIFALSAKDVQQLKQKAFELARYFESNIVVEERNQSIFSEHTVRTQLQNKICELLKLEQEDIDMDSSLSDFGLDIYLVQLLNDFISKEYGTQYTNEDYFELKSIRELSSSICNNRSQKYIQANYDKKLYVKAAISLALEREHMTERLAFVADDLENVIRILDAYCNNEVLADGYIYTGNVLKQRITVSEIGQDINIRSLIDSKNYNEICRLWTMGYKVDFYELHAHKVHTPLPLYPFKKDRYFVEDMAEKNVVDTLFTSGVPQRVIQPFSKRFSTADYFVKQHVVGGKNYLQGVACLDLFQNFAMQTMNINACISNIMWKRPIDLTNNEINVTVDIKKNDNNIEIEAYSENENNKALYCVANISDKENYLLALNTQSISEEATRQLSPSAFYDIYDKRGIMYGNELKGIRNIRYSDNAVMASISFEDQFSADNNTIRILDAAVQCGIILIHGMDNGVNRYVPFSADAIKFYGNIPSKASVFIKRVGTINDMLRNRLIIFDAVLKDENGNTLVELKRFVCKPIFAQTEPFRADDTIKELTYYKEYELKNISDENTNTWDNIIIFTNQSFMDEELEVFSSENKKVITVIPAAQYGKIKENVYSINVKDENDVSKLFEDSNIHDNFCIMYLWDLFADDESIENINNIFSLNHAMVKNSHLKKVGVIYAHKYRTVLSDAYGMAVDGFQRTVEREKSGFSYKYVCLNGDYKYSDILQVLYTESAVMDEKNVVYNRNERQILKFNKWYPKSVHDLSDKIRGTWIITGGMGGLGKLFSEYLSHKYHVNLILTGSSPINDEKTAFINSIRDDNEIEYVSCNITNYDDVHQLVEYAKMKYSTITGIIQSAGIIKDSFLRIKTLENFHQVADVKIKGIENFYRTLINEKINYFITFSSIAGVIGNAGQCDYAFANAFMDNYVKLMSYYMKGCKCISINWPYWEEGGMRVPQDVVKNMYDMYGIRPLPSDTGIHMFENILSTDENQIAVFYGLESKVEEQLGIKKEVVAERKTVSQKSGRVKEMVLNILSDELKMKQNEFDEEETFENYGVDSVLSVSISDRLAEIFSSVSKTILFECINIRELCEYLEKHSEILQDASEETECISKSLVGVYEEKNNFMDQYTEATEGNISDTDIAIIGLSGQYPMAANTAEYWDNLKAGRDCISLIPSERWDRELYYTKEKGVDGRTCSKWGGFLKDIDKFDPVFFKITPGEATMMDPQERLFLQETYHAIEDAGYSTKKLKDSNVGVYVGGGSSKYEMLALEESLREKLVLVNNMNSNIANRVSYYFDFHGPSISIDTMCSSSLTAIDMACKALQNHEVDYSVAGGVNLLLHPYKYLVLSLKEFLSTDGRCRGFGEGGDGYVPGEGVGVFVLKRLNDAVRDGDNIYCVIKGSLLNHGGHTRGYSVPNSKSQAQLIESSLKKASIHIEDIDYMEMHGTGTSLGDPIEIEGVSQALGSQKPLCGKIPFGTVKSNIGHLEAAASVAGITKVILQCKHNCLVPSIHAEQLNKNIDLNRVELKIQRTCETWDHTSKNYNVKPHLATVSSFGAGGSNGHIILEEYIAKDQNGYCELKDIDKIFVFSDMSADRLRRKVRSFYEYVSMNSFDRVTLRNMAYTLKIGRDAMKERIVIVAEDAEQLRNGLSSVARGENNSELIQLTRLNESSLLQKASDWCSGSDINWEAYYNTSVYKKISLPLYLFEKQRCWIDVSCKIGDSLKEYVIPSGNRELIQNIGTERTNKKVIYNYICCLFKKLFIITDVNDVADKPFEEIGIDSIMIRRLNVEMERDIKNLSPTVFFECNTMNLLVDYIAENHSDFVVDKLFYDQPEEKAIVEKPSVKETNKIFVDDDEIAIIGVSGKYPGAKNIEELWNNLSERKTEFREIPSDRWDYTERFNHDMLSLPEGTVYSKWGAFLDDAYRFDARFFSIAPVEAEMMDPQERLFLECAWNTIEDAGYADEIYRNRNQNSRGKQVGVFVGVTSLTYSMWGEVEWSNHSKSYPKTFPWSIANRVSYQFNLSGPSMAIDTACSSSLTAIHLACSSIKNGECTMAIAGGVNLYLHQGKFIHLCQTRMLSPTGTSNPFGNGADGFVPGEGVGALMLKRKSDAIADGDRIYAVIRSTAVNHGGHTTGYTVPNPVMQSAVIEDALNRAEISPIEISHVEVHGTGTDLGDPIEIKGLTKAFRTQTDKNHFCAISSIKGNIGHAEAAAGIAGVTKILLEMKHNALVPNVYYNGLNSKINFDDTPFYVQDQLTEWNDKMCAAVSSFGAGGSNCNVIIEKYEDNNSRSIIEKDVYAVPVSAMTEEALTEYMRSLLKWCQEHNGETHVLHNITYTLQRRARMSYGRVFVASSVNELIQLLRTSLNYERTQESVIAGNYCNVSDNDVKQLEAWQTGKQAELPVQYALSYGVLMSLPLYVFQGKEYRFISKVNKADNEVNGNRIPLSISCNDYFVREHKMKGKSLLPAACSMEFARTALGSAHSLHNVVFGRKITENEIRNGLYLEKKDDAKYVISSETDGQHVLCVSGSYKEKHENTFRNNLFETESFKYKCSQYVENERLYGYLKKAGLEYGEHMRCIEECYRSEEQIYAKLSMPSTIRDNNKLLLEPCMLDSAFQLVALLVDEEDYENNLIMLPYSVKEYSVYNKITRNATAFVKRKKQEPSDFISFDISIVNSDGSDAVRAIGYTVKKKMQYKSANNTIQTKTVVKTSNSALRDHVLNYVTANVAKVLGYNINEIKQSEYLEAYGIESVAILNLTEILEKDFGSISKTLFFEYKTIQEITDYFMENHLDTCKKLFSAIEETVSEDVETVLEEEERYVPQTVQSEGTDEIAIIGMNGIFPGASDLDEFWRNLYNGVDSITEIPAERWNGNEFYDSDKNKRGAIYSKWGGFVQDIDKFDPLFFRISPRDAEIMDPQERMFLQCAWKAVEDAGYTKYTLPSKKTSVYVGVMYGQYQLYGAEESMKGTPMALNSSFSSIANRVSYILNLSGPSLAVDTMCSSSLTALHLACSSIHYGESEMSIVGGVNLSIHKNKYTLLCHGKFLSSDGRCRSFGEGGDGYVPGEGVGAIVLKSLKKAKQDGDHILGIVQATAINHGGKTNGYTVPNPQAQASVLLDAINRSGIKPNEISYIEAHGTGTALGDPIEMLSINKTYGKEFEEGQKCYLGSVKSNIGHLESAAGIAAIIKVLLQFKNKCMVPSLHSDVINQKIDIDKTPFYIPHSPEKWEQTQRADGTKIPRMAGINSFGAGGSNAHVILREYEQSVQLRENQQERIYTLSAFNDERLLAYAYLLMEYLKNNRNVSMESLAYVMQTGRESLDSRAAFIAKGQDELVRRIQNYIDHRTDENVFVRNADTFGRSEDEIKNVTNYDIRDLARLWADGRDVLWNELYENHMIPKISIPTYPFAKERYWVPSVDETEAVSTTKSTMITISKDKYYVRDHKLSGISTVPGVALLEEMRKATGIDKLPVCIEQVVFQSFVEADDKDADLNVKLEKCRNDYYDAVLTGQNNRIAVKAKFDFSAKSINYLRTEREYMPSDGIYLDKETCYRFFESLSIEYTGSMRRIKEARIKDGSVYAILENSTYMIALLDSILQVVMLEAYKEAEKHKYVPYSMDRIVLHKPLEGDVLVYVESNRNTEAENMNFNVFVWDENGELCISIYDYVVKMLEEPRSDSEKELDELLLMLKNGELNLDETTELLEEIL